MKRIADISIFNDFSELMGPESTGQGDSSEPVIGSNFEYNIIRRGENLRRVCEGLSEKLDLIAANPKLRKSRALQADILKELKEVDERLTDISERSPNDTPAIRGAFYDVSKTYDSVFDKYLRIYSGYSGKYSPYISRESYVNQPVPQRTPASYGSSGFPISYGGLMGESSGGNLGALANIPTTPETALASAAAASLVKMHQNFKNWYNRVMEFENRMDQLDRQHVPLSPKCKELQDFVLNKLNLPEDSAPQSDMMEILARSH